jgi:hypothetical protein
MLQRVLSFQLAFVTIVTQFPATAMQRCSAKPTQIDCTICRQPDEPPDRFENCTPEQGGGSQKGVDALLIKTAWCLLWATNDCKKPDGSPSQCERVQVSMYVECDDGRCLPAYSTLCCFVNT